MAESEVQAKGLFGLTAAGAAHAGKGAVGAMWWYCEVPTAEQDTAPRRSGADGHRRSAAIAALLLLFAALAMGLLWHDGLMRAPPLSRSRMQLGQVQSLWARSVLEYKLLNVGTCAESGMAPINELNLCNYAAGELRLKDTTAVSTDFINVSEGCYYFTDTVSGDVGLWLGINQLNKGKGAETSEPSEGKIRRPICMTQPNNGTTTSALTPPSTPSPSKPKASTSRGSPPPPKPSTTAKPKSLIKGICYSPVPFRGHQLLTNDDFMATGSAALWRSSGRGDLATIKALGANTVRLYGNDPEIEHGPFLDEALAHGLQVIVGMSDYPYIQMRGNCASTGFNCYAKIKEQYAANLRHGFLSGNKYHRALRTVIIMNEPDLKFQPVLHPPHFCKALVSALDGMLDAEQEAGVTDGGVNFTATFSFAVCEHCSQLSNKAAAGQMLEFREAMRNPGSVGYAARNDLWAAYKTRFTNSMNTANPASDLRPLFLDAYDAMFQGTPVFIGEYHFPWLPNVHEDLEAGLAIAENSSTLLTGLSFFEFQVRYDKGGSEMMFGMFGLGNASLGDVKIGKNNFSAHCLQPMKQSGGVKPNAAQRPCGRMEAGLDYRQDMSLPGAWMRRIPDVEHAEGCCYSCRQDRRCRSWTWRHSSRAKEDSGGFAGSLCRLFNGMPVHKLRRQGFVSGSLPPNPARPLQVNAPHRSFMPTAVAKAYGGSGVDKRKLCRAVIADT